MLKPKREYQLKQKIISREKMLQLKTRAFFEKWI